MTKIKTKRNWNLERKALFIFTILFIAVILGTWTTAMKLRSTIASNNAVINVDVRALIEIEQIRNLAESQISNSRSYFLLGSKSLFDEQKKNKQDMQDLLASFEKKYSLPQIPEIIKKIQSIGQQQDEIFDQAMTFREKQTESKIVGQFYNSKTNPLRQQIDKALDEIVAIHNAELNRARHDAKEAASRAEVQIPKGVAWFTGLTALLFAGMILLVLRMLRERSRQLSERTRLYDEAKKAIQARDEVLSAISHDIKEPLTNIAQTAENMTKSLDETHIAACRESIVSNVVVAEDRIKDILDQAKADLGNITLRLDQLGIDGILEDARLMLQPLAKQRDIRLEINSVNPPVLAFVDRERVMRVLANLVGNAIKFSPKHSKVAVKVRSDQQFVFISVKDSGTGIPEGQVAGIFDNFWQSRKTADQGAGVGLAVVKTIIEAHGGTVQMENSKGHGTTFTFSLPRRRPAGAYVGRPAAPAVRLSRTKSSDLHEGSTLI